MVGCQGHGPGQGLCHLPQVGLLRCHHCGPLTRTHLPPALIWGGGALPDEHLPGSPGNYPPLTVDCVESIAGSDYKKKQFKDKNSHVFWGRLECGLILSSGRLCVQAVQGLLEIQAGLQPLCADPGPPQGQAGVPPADPG